MARRRRKNDSGAEGVLLVDKPVGPTSHDVVGQVRRALGTSRVGHAGTLDPLASGLLVVLVGRYTKLSPYLTGADKAYEAIVRFGRSTTTDDAEGETVDEGELGDVDEARVKAALEARLGEQDQVPPAYSAVQVDGERLYARARRGETVTPPTRTVNLRALQLRAWSPPDARVDVVCSKGTYIRSLARDLGADLGVPAHLGGLRRTRSGDYDVDEAVSAEAVAPEHLRTGPAAVRGLPRIDLDAEAARRMQMGQALEPLAEHASLLEGEPLLAVHDERMIAVAALERGALRVRRGLWS